MYNILYTLYLVLYLSSNKVYLRMTDCILFNKYQQILSKGYKVLIQIHSYTLISKGVDKLINEINVKSIITIQDYKTNNLRKTACPLYLYNVIHSSYTSFCGIRYSIVFKCFTKRYWIGLPKYCDDRR